MKIYFLGAISGLDKYKKNYQKEVRILEKLGHNVVSDHILERDKDKTETFVIKNDVDYFEFMSSRIKSSDLVVADISFPTANIGFEISHALSNNVPVIALYSAEKGNKVIPLLVGNQSDLLKLCSYSDETLERILKSEVDKIQDSNSAKFTILINESIAEYLDWVSKKNNLTRSAFIKDLIEKFMVSDKSYKKNKTT